MVADGSSSSSSSGGGGAAVPAADEDIPAHFDLLFAKIKS